MYHVNEKHDLPAELRNYELPSPPFKRSTFIPPNPFAVQKIFEPSLFSSLAGNNRTPSPAVREPFIPYRPPARQRSRSEGDFFGFLPKPSATLDEQNGPFGGITGSMIVSNDSLPPFSLQPQEFNKDGRMSNFLENGNNDGGNWVGDSNRFFEEPEECSEMTGQITETIDEDIYKIVSGLRSDSLSLPYVSPYPLPIHDAYQPSITQYQPLPYKELEPQLNPKPRVPKDEDFEEEEMEQEEEDSSEGSSTVTSSSKKRKRASASPRVRGRPREADHIPLEIPKLPSKTTNATRIAAEARRIAAPRFVCDLCGESFTRKYNLKGHQRAHRNEKPYVCSNDGCEKSFSRSHDCKRHEKLHLKSSDGVSYSCEECNKSFARLDALQRHHRSELCVKNMK